jgi:hypothetical protein
MSALYIIGQDAIDIAKLADVQLHKVPCSLEEAPDTSWRAAEEQVAAGEDIDLFMIDPYRLTQESAGHIIHALVGVFKAWHDFRIA